jgi:short-subunit dehydrogenase
LDGIQNLQESLPMTVRLKRVEDQVTVLTGASSGIGLATAHAAAARGARLVLVSRNDAALPQAARECNDMGGRAIAVVADVARREDLEHVARVAVETFGGFDTWINNAGVSIYGRIDEVPVEDFRRMFDTNFWGVVHGSLAAVAHLKTRGGALINIGSEVSDVAIPLQGMYSASKHAVKGFTDALRIELEERGDPVSVTLIRPTAIDSMFVENAKNYMEVEPQLPPPLYTPEVVAAAILEAARYRHRDIYVGANSKISSLMAKFMPRGSDYYLRRTAFKSQRTRQPARTNDPSALESPHAGMQERRGQEPTRHSSAYTTAATHPKASGAALLGAGIAALSLWRLARKPGTPLARLWR